MTRSSATELSPSARNICAQAAEHFAEFGYDGSSLATIAERSGMRKASLYAHFSGKDELFARVMSLAVHEELLVAREAFSEPHTGPLPGGAFLDTLQPRFDNSASFRFLLRAGYAPPQALREEISSAYRAYESEVRALFVAALPETLDPARAETITQAYLGMIDSLQVELIFHSPDTYEARRTALWAVLTAFAT